MAAEAKPIVCCVLVRADGKTAGYVRARPEDRAITYFQRHFHLTTERTPGGWRIYRERL